MLDIDENTGRILNDKGIEATPAERRAMDTETARLGAEADQTAREYQHKLDNDRVGAIMNKVAMVALSYPQLNEVLEAHELNNPYTPDEAVQNPTDLLEEAVVELDKLNPSLAAQVRAVASAAYADITL